MVIKQSLLLELDKETANTRRVVERLRDEQLDWRPHSKSMTLGELSAHVVELHNWVSKALCKGVFDFKADYTPFKPTSVADIATALESGYLLNKASIEASTDASWGDEWTLKAGDWVIAQMPKAGAIRFIINNHLVHHRGQLTVYLRLLDIPVPGLYGPSADEANG